MDAKLEPILDAADWKELTPMLIAFAHAQICKAFWRGLPVKASEAGLPCLDGMSAEDFVSDALSRIIDGVRAYNSCYSLEQNLKGVIRSQIWSWNKSANRQPLTPGSTLLTEDGFELDLVESAADNHPTPFEVLARSEEIAGQHDLLTSFEAFVGGDKDLLQLLSAYQAGVYTPRAIAERTGLPAARISELKRKLTTKMNRFVVSSASALGTTRAT